MLAMLAACEAPTTYPAGLEPLEENTAEWPAAVDGEEHPETVSWASGSEGDEYDWVHGRGYVHAGMHPTWDVLKDPEIGIDRREVDEYDWEEDTDPDYEVSYTTHNVVQDVITIDFDVGWRQGIARGTAELPTGIAGRWDKTDGFEAITVLSGSFVLIYKAPERTGIELIYHLMTPQRDPANPERAMQDFYDSIVAVAGGGELPSY